MPATLLSSRDSGTGLHSITQNQRSRMRHTRTVTILIAAVCLLAATAVAQTTTTVTSDASTPVVGLAGSETVQINVINTAAASPSGVAASCVGAITFYNSSGSAIGSATSFSIGTGQVFSEIGRA